MNFLPVYLPELFRLWNKFKYNTLYESCILNEAFHLHGFVVKFYFPEITSNCQTDCKVGDVAILSNAECAQSFTLTPNFPSVQLGRPHLREIIRKLHSTYFADPTKSIFDVCVCVCACVRACVCGVCVCVCVCVCESIVQNCLEFKSIYL